MDFQNTQPSAPTDTSDTEEQRGAHRFTSMIRAAKLVCAQGEFVCVIRDVSESGISVKTFHPLPEHHAMSLELQNGERFDLDLVRHNDNQASFRFKDSVALDNLLQEDWNYPKRQLRLGINIPVQLVMLTGRFDAYISNLSQQGARLESDVVLAIDQKFSIHTDELPEIRATTRWRRDSNYGCVFETTFALQEFAYMAAMLQCPVLFEGSRSASDITERITANLAAQHHSRA